MKYIIKKILFIAAFLGVFGAGLVASPYIMPEKIVSSAENGSQQFDYCYNREAEQCMAYDVSEDNRPAAELPVPSAKSAQSADETAAGQLNSFDTANSPLPEPESQQVFCTFTGECYHKANCPYLKSKISIPLSDAKQRGLRPCSKCMSR